MQVWQSASDNRAEPCQLDAVVRLRPSHNGHSAPSRAFMRIVPAWIEPQTMAAIVYDKLTGGRVAQPRAGPRNNRHKLICNDFRGLN